MSVISNILDLVSHPTALVSKVEEVADEVNSFQYFKLNMSFLRNIVVFPWIYFSMPYHMLNMTYFSLKVWRRSKTILPTLARLCLISTFLENGINVFFNWNMEITNIESLLGCGNFLATIFFMIVLVGLLGGCCMVLLRWKVDIACALLLGVTCIEVLFQFRLYCL